MNPSSLTHPLMDPTPGAQRASGPGLADPRPEVLQPQNRQPSLVGPPGAYLANRHIIGLHGFGLTRAYLGPTLPITKSLDYITSDTLGPTSSAYVGPTLPTNKAKDPTLPTSKPFHCIALGVLVPASCLPCQSENPWNRAQSPEPPPIKLPGGSWAAPRGSQGVPGHLEEVP